jgi:FkbM family methyltransferase
MRTAAKRLAGLASPARWARWFRRHALRLGDRMGVVSTAETDYLGRVFAYPVDSIIGRQIAGGGEWDPILKPVTAILLSAESPVVCEVGSNIGASLLQILAAKPAARAIAFEPSLRFLPLLRRNLAGLAGVEIHSVLLGREEGGTAILYNNASTASAARKRYHAHEPRRAQTVAVKCLDSFCLGCDRHDLLKLDTDGFDFEVLRGGERSLRRHRPVLFFEFTPSFLEQPVDDLAWLRALGYRRLTCFSARGELLGTTQDPATAIAWAQADPSDYVDILACAEGSPADARRDELLLALAGQPAAPLAECGSAATIAPSPGPLQPSDRVQEPALEPLR